MVHDCNDDFLRGFDRSCANENTRPIETAEDDCSELIKSKRVKRAILCGCWVGIVGSSIILLLLLCYELFMPLALASCSFILIPHHRGKKIEDGRSVTCCHVTTQSRSRSRRITITSAKNVSQYWTSALASSTMLMNLFEEKIAKIQLHFYAPAIHSIVLSHEHRT